MSVNKAILLGRLGADPDAKYLPDGKCVCELRLATNESWIKDGQKQERTEWHRVKLFGKVAEVCAKYMAKGRELYVEGRIQTRKWTDKEGKERYTTEIVADSVQFVGGGGKAGSAGPGQVQAAPGDDDIPF
jgi:single-strand DNA-binding protein